MRKLLDVMKSIERKKEYQKKWRKDNPNKVKKYAADYYQRNKEYWNEYYKNKYHQKKDC